MSFPKITIVTPSYNQGKYLDETMRSVLDQNYPNLEFIVIDGGSTDESVEIIKRYANRLAYWVSEKDKGQTDALNKGIARCTGEIFGYINSDDLLLPGSLDRVARAWREENAQWIVGWSKYLDMDGGDYPYVVRPIGRKIDWFLHNPIPQQSSFWATKFFRELGPFRTDMHYCFDYEYWMRLRFQADVRPYSVRKCLGAFRLHDQSKTVALQEKFAADFKLVRDEYKKYLSPVQRLAWWAAKRGEDAERTRETAWSALHRKDLKVARRQALTAMGEQPLSAQSWKLLLCSLRGR